MMNRDEEIYLLVDDLGFSFIEEIQKHFPERVINCGITEQSMVGIAAGLALGGKKPYLYGTAPFLIMRPYEQLRDDVCYNNLDVKIFATGAGDFLGFTHNLSKDEDVKILKHLPNLKVYIPKSKEELKKVIIKSYGTKRPAYIRL